jgi:anaerobic selenocysteine-containing dehydrogenase
VSETVVRTTCPRDCYDGCGVLVTLREDGSVHNVRGDPDDPVANGALCRKCSIGYNGAFLDPLRRLTQPLRRSGAKGSGSFVPVTWDQALAEIAERLTAVADRPGPQAILNAHYSGTLSVLAFAFPQRFFMRLGATEVDPDSICNKAGHVALDYVYGTSVTGFDPRTAKDAACILVWGANPSASGPHVDEHWLRPAPGRVIVVDPIRTETAAGADLHLQPFPGSDAALAFALLHVIARDGLADRGFLAQHTTGWDELEPLLESCDPAWGESVTGVPAGMIEQAAAIYGAGPSLLWLGQGLQRQPTGGNVVRAISLLPAVSGNLARPGAGMLYLNDQLEIDGEWMVGARLGEPPPPISHMQLAETLEDPARAQAFICWNINPAASNPQQARLRRALAREDLFTLAVDLFMTDTAELADIVLPAASFLEFDDVVAPYFHMAVSAQVKAVDPPGQALPNQEIFRRLAAAMGYAEPELFESDEAMLDRIAAGSGVVADFAELAERRSVPLSEEIVIQFADLQFATPSGRIELASAAAEGDAHPRLPQPWADERPADGTLRLLSPATAWTLNDTFANDTKIGRRLGQATVTLHPRDAAERGLEAGQRALLENETGALELAVEIGELAPPGVAIVPKGRWPKLEPSRHNVNVLNPGIAADMGGSSSVHGVHVRVSAAP